MHLLVESSTGNNVGILQAPAWGGKAEVSLSFQARPLMWGAPAQSKAGLANLSCSASV